MKYVIVFMMLLTLIFASTGFAKEVKIFLHNDTDVKKTVWLKWTNHPHGCQISKITGRLMCEMSVLVAETAPDQKHTKIVKDAPGTAWGDAAGRKYCAEWENTVYHERTDKSETRQCFEIEENTIEVYVTPNGVDILVEDEDGLQPLGE